MVPTGLKGIQTANRGVQAIGHEFLTASFDDRDFG